jgi:hypothetical protein
MPNETSAYRDGQWVELNRPIAHGKYATYSNYACRCDDCRKAHNEWHRQYRQTEGGRKRTLVANRKARLVQTECAEWLKQNHPDIYNSIADAVNEKVEAEVNF